MSAQQIRSAINNLRLSPGCCVVAKKFQSLRCLCKYLCDVQQ
jgi:hypothetical protein